MKLQNKNHVTLHLVGALHLVVAISLVEALNLVDALQSTAKVIYPLFMKRASLNKKRIDYLSIHLVETLHLVGALHLIGALSCRYSIKASQSPQGPLNVSIKFSKSDQRSISPRRPIILIK